MPSDSGGVSVLVAVGMGGGSEKRGGEYCVQSDLTIFVILVMLLFEEHINLDGRMSRRSWQQGEEYERARDEVLPWILSKHPNTFKPPPQPGKDGVLLAPFVVQHFEVDI